MRRLILTVCGLILGVALVVVGALPAASQNALQGHWVATKAERNGAAAADVVGHRMSLSGGRFEIRSKDGKTVYAGTVRVDPKAKPPAIDFVHTSGPLRGKTWKGIYALNGDMLTTCDNAADMSKGRPTAFEAKNGSGYVLITFTRVK